MIGSQSCDLGQILAPVKTVLRFDLETLARDFTEEERLAFYNEVSSKYKQYLMNCSPGLNREEDLVFRGEFTLARLLLAASFKVNGEDRPDIVGRFREDEYRILFDFEEMKIFDYLSIDDIVEFIERREGKVYELVKKYYDRQYYMLDTKWGKLMGPLASAFNTRYRERRRKIEEAVIAYMKKKPLTLFISEIEEAVQKILEARRLKAEASALLGEFEDKLGRVEDEIEALEARIATRTPSQESLRVFNVLEGERGELSQLKRLVKELEEAKKKLVEKEENLRLLAVQYKDREAAYELLQSEAENLREKIRAMEEKIREYQGLVEMLSFEKAKLESRIEEMNKALRGELEGHLVTVEEAWALEESLVQRMVYYANSLVSVYDPVRRESRNIRWSRRILYQIHPEGRPSGKGVVLVKEKGLVRRRKEIVLDAATLVHQENYNEKGYDTIPVGLGEILEHIEAKLADAEKGEYYHIIVISSPTGFTEKAIQYIENSDEVLGLVSKYITIYLVDPISGKVYYNRKDPAAEANLGLATPVTEDEKLDKAIKYIMSDEARDKALLNSSVSPFITGQEVMKAIGLDAVTIRKAFEKLQKEGIGRLEIVNGKPAFIYSKITG